ncbi:alanine racemase [Rubrivirga sp. IMCC45206]|uniref:alanine racemase n=1 Tax=Rubrivirga sp. IMCC45206 TaxID=3391614 RepID=UPI0039901FA7
MIPVALRAEVDLDAIRHNARTLGVAGAMAVVKADAYGHGAVPVARALVDEGVEWLAVATVPEAEALRDAGVSTRILVFAAPLPEFLPAYERLGLDAVVSSPEVAAAVMARAAPVPVHVKVDTGMHRIGLAPATAAETVRQLRAAGVEVAALWTHFSMADAPDPSASFLQIRRFDGVLRELGADAPPLVHLANGPAHVRFPPVASGPALHRLGGVLYGLRTGVLPEIDTTDLRPAMRLVARVVHLQTVPAGESVSYGETWTAPRPTRVATLAVGYADGLPRALSNVGHVGIGGGRAPIVGRICMDVTMVDVDGLDVAVGDDAVVFGPGGPTAEAAATAAGTIVYELTAGLTARVPRVYRRTGGSEG